MTVAPNGDLTYDPTGVAALQALDDGESVDDTFTYTIEDPSGASDTATVTVTVDGVNDAPTAMDDTYETDEDVTLNLPAPGVLVNDDDVDTGDTLTAVLDTDVSNGSLTLNPDGSFSYTPDLDFNGTDSFTYHASDGTADSPTVTATITVAPVNDGPNAVDDLFGTDEDIVLIIADPGVLTNDTDPELDPLTVTAFDAVSAEGATVSVDPGGGFTYDPTGAAALQALADGESVDDTFTYTIEDPDGASDTATVTVTVDGVNDPPTAIDDGGPAFTTNEDTAFTTGNVLTNDTDPDATDVLSVLSFDDTLTVGTVTSNGDGTFNYDPAGNFEALGAGESATDTFTYTVSDGNGGTDTATVTITIDGVNDAPLAVGETFNGAGGNFDPAIGNTTLHFANAASLTHPHVFQTGDVLDNDTDPEGDPLTISAVDGDAGAVGSPKVLGSGAVVTLNAGGEFTYSPPLGFEGTDTFTYTVSDGLAGSDATVTIEIAGMVWYLDEDASGGGNDGRSASPFESLAAFNDEQGGGLDSQPEAGDLIFLHHSADTYSSGIALLDQQKLYGEGVELLVAGQSLVSAGTRPELANTAGDAVTVLADVTNGDRTGIEIRGLALSSTSLNAIDVTSEDTQAVEVTIGDNLIDGSSAEGIDVNPGSSGDFTVTLENNTFSTASPTGHAIDVATAGTNSAAVEVAINGNTDVTSASGIGIRVNGSLGTGTLFITGFADNTVHGNTGGAGVMVTNVTFDADPSDTDFDEVAGGTWSIGENGNPVGGSGMYLGTALLEVEGHLSFDQLDVFAGNGAGLDVAGAGLFGGGTPGTGFRLDVAGGTIEATGGPGVVIDPATLGISFDSVTSTASPTTGISLTNVGGIFSATGGSIATAGVGSGPTFELSGGSINASYGGSVASALGNSVQVQNMTGGTVTLSGPVDDDGAGISITGNDAATSVTFNGALDLDTTVNTAFTATGDGSVTVASAPTNTISTTTGTGVLVNGVDAGVEFDFDNVTVSNGVAAGISIQSSAGTKTFGLVSVTNSGGAGLFASTAGTVDVTNVASSIATTGQPAVDADNTTFGATFASLTSTGSGSTGIDLASVGGSFTATSVTIDGTTGAGVQLTGNPGEVALNGGTIGATTTITGNAVDVDGGAGAVTIGAAITNSAARSVEVTSRPGGAVTVSGAIADTGTGINVASNSGGSTTFSNASKVLNTGANPAVTLANNGSHVVHFTGGGLDIDTTSGAGFSATGGGTANVTGSGNTVNTTTGTGVNIADVTIGASDVTFERVGVAGGSNGIVLDTTGTTGGFTVTGNGAMTGGVLDRNGSGGTIGSTIGARLTDAHDVTLRQMNFLNNGDHAVQGTVGSDHVLSAVTIQNPTNHGWEATDLEGTNRIDHGSLVTQFNGINQDGVRLINTDTDFTSFTVDNSTFSNSETGNDAFFHRALGTTAGSIVVTDSTFTGLDADGVQVANDGSGTVVTTVQGNSFTTADATFGDGNNGLALNLGGTGIHQFLVGGPNAGDENTFSDVNRLGDNSGVINVTAAGAGTGSTSRVIGTIQRNTISDSDGRRGISVLFEASGGTGHGGHTIVIDNNSVNDVAREGIYVGMSSVAGRSNTGNKITITNNNVGGVSVVSTAGNREGIEIEAFHDGAGGGSIEADILVEDNVAVINNTDETFRVTNDAFVLGGNPAASTTLDVTVLGNVFTNNDVSGDSFEHRNFDAGSTSCLDVNAVSQAADRNNSIRGYLITRDAGTFGIEGLAAGTHANAAVNTFVDARNDGGASVASGNDFTGGVTCSLP